MNAPNLSPGTTVAGKYSVRALMGYSGAAATYHAVSTQGYEVALKLFSPAVAQRPDIMSMIERIYGETNQLPPELIVPIIDAGYDPATGAPFGVTQIAPVPSLAQLVARRPLTPNEVAGILKSIARVLDGAHVREVMHHALKPTNVFVDPASGHNARLIDFGANIPRSVVPTHEGYALSAPWMAPEQVQGTVPAAGPADVFGAALVAFYALTGVSYWRSCQGQAPDINGWQQELMSARTPASSRAGELGLRIPQALDSVFARALAPDPQQRYRTVGELLSAFEVALGSREPEMASTLAFPAISDGPGPGGGYAPGPGGQGPGGGGGYGAPPGPGGGGGYGAPPGPGGGYGPPPGPGGAPATDAGYPPAPAPYNAAAAYTATVPTSTPAIVPGGPQGGQPVRSASGKFAPILVGAVAILLIGGAVAAWVAMSGPSTPDTGPIAVTAPTTTANAATTGAPTGEAPPTPPPAAAGVQATITCAPGCDEIKIDDKPVDDMTKPLVLSPGQHTVTVSKSGYEPQTETITVSEGQPFSKEFKLAQAKQAATETPKQPVAQGTTPKPPAAPTTTSRPPTPTRPSTSVPVPIKKCTKLIKTNCSK